LILALISVIQASLLFGIVRVWCDLPGSAAFQWITLSALAMAGTAIGLLISALARSEEVATALVPIVVIPQIILAGVVAPLSGVAQWMAKGFVTVYWAQETLEHLLPESDRTLLGRSSAAWGGTFGLVLCHLAVAATLAIVVLSRFDRETR